MLLRYPHGSRLAVFVKPPAAIPMKISQFLKELFGRSWREAFKKTRSIMFCIPIAVGALVWLYPGMSEHVPWWVPLAILGAEFILNLFTVAYEMVDEREMLIKKLNDAESRIVESETIIECLASIHGMGREISRRPRPPTPRLNHAYTELIGDYDKWVAGVHALLSVHEKAKFDHVHATLDATGMNHSQRVWTTATFRIVKQLEALADIREKRQQVLDATRLAMISQAPKS